MDAEQHIAVSEAGCPVGQYHPKARLSDAQVELIRHIHEEGVAGYKTLAKHFGVSWKTIEAICTYRRRNTYTARHIPRSKPVGARNAPPA